MALFQRKIGPVFLKEDSETAEFIEKMNLLSERASASLKKEIDKEIKLAQYGELGEKNIAFELMNTFGIRCIYQYGETIIQSRVRAKSSASEKYI